MSAPWIRAQSASPHARLRVAVAGTNGRGLSLIRGFARLPNTEIACVCDVDERAVAKGLRAAAEVQATTPAGLRDFRRALEDQTIDALVIATPDHWHAPMSLLALAAGKHVFVEKPCSHNPREGELLVDAAARTQRLVQMGNQRRSFPVLREAIESIRRGAIGRPTFARGWYANDRRSIGRGRQAAVPAELDFNLWQGPAPRRPFVDNLVHYNWHWHWHWGTGEALNNGTHEMDVCRWALGVDFASRVTSSGGRLHFDDDWETPDTQTISWEFPGGRAMTWEGRSCNGFPSESRARGAMIYGTAGSALLDGEEVIFYDPKHQMVRHIKPGQTVDGTDTLSSTGANADLAHFRNFVDGIREGTPLTAPIADAHVSTTLLHLGNIAQRVGRVLHCDPSTGRILDDPAAMALWRRDYEPGWEPTI